MAAAEECPLVLVTGGSGFIATHIVQQLQQQDFKVRTTVRSLENEAKVNPIKELCPEAKHPVEIVEADLTNAESWENIVNGCTYVIHVASPFPTQVPNNEDDVIKPAVEGTEAILKACQKAKIQRLVITSSFMAVIGSLVGQDLTKTFTEEDWGDLEKVQDPYNKSKIMAEKAAWDFLKELPEEERFELVVINPGYVMGPVLCGGTSFLSMEVCRRLLERSMPAVPKLFLPIVDVRDVADAHVKALTCADAAGHRHIVTGDNLWMKEIAQIISKEFKPQGYSVPTLHCPYFAVWVRSLFDKTLKMVLPNIGKSVKVDNTRMKDVLGVNAREANETIIDMCYSLIEKGLVKKSKKYKGRKGEGEEENEENKEENKEANGTINTGDEEGEKKEEIQEEKKEEKEEKENKEADDEEKKDEEKKDAEKEEKPEENEIKEEKKADVTAATEDAPATEAAAE